ncbi:MAG: hypothetical protein PHU49_00485 [Syntrophorhabdaceae bacterium]|nr:hypothetical protein [Syntrophorhabdaceae bacterium]
MYTNTENQKYPPPPPGGGGASSNAARLQPPISDAAPISPNQSWAEKKCWLTIARGLWVLGIAVVYLLRGLGCAALGAVCGGMAGLIIAAPIALFSFLSGSGTADAELAFKACSTIGAGIGFLCGLIPWD